MTKQEVKKILSHKFKDENCGFKYSDINVIKDKDQETHCIYYLITIKEYEHITFKISDNIEHDYWVEMYYTDTPNEYETYTFTDTLESAIKIVGYWISSRF